MKIKYLQNKGAIRTVLFVLLLSLVGTTDAQGLRRVSKKSIMQPVQQQRSNRDSGSNTMQGVMNSMPRTNRTEGELDYTTYDWQSNSGAITRTIAWPDGKVNFAYTMATNASYTDRGTGIGTYDAVNDEWIPSEGRVENQKTGFGSIARYGQNGIVVAAHTATDCRIFIQENKDNIVANSISAVSILDNTYDIEWPNVMTSGPNRNIIHVVATAYDHISIPGMENVNQPILYFRSQDGGQTWDKQNIILPFMNANYCLDWGSNVCYWMETTDDNCLALVVNNAWSDGMVIYSYDNGETWQRKVFYKHPNPFGTFDNMFLYPRWTSCQWDSQHHLHVLYEFNGCTGEPGSGSYYPNLGGVAYWNETMPYNINGTTQSAIPGNLTPGQPFVMDTAYLYHDIYASWWLWSDASHEMWPEYIGYLPALTDNGNPEPDPYNVTEFNIEDRSLHGSYNSGVCAMPVLCMVPGTDDMVAVWCAMDENNTDGNGNYYYKLFASMSTDGGATWSNMKHLTNDFMYEYSECVYPQAVVVGNQLVIACQMDGETGSYVMSADNDAYDNYYGGLTFDLSDLFGYVPTNGILITTSANPANGGTVTGGGYYQSGQTCTLSATANSGYTFVNWTENGMVVSTNATYSFAVTSSRNLVANFDQVSSGSYVINATANPSEGGTVTIGGTFPGETLVFEPFEEYSVGSKIASSAIAAGHDWWTTWSNAPGGSEDGVVANLNGTQCGHLVYGNDQVLLLGDEENGIYDLEFDILVPQGKNGYFNILHHFAGSNSTWAMQCYLHLTNDGQNSTSAPGHGTIHAGSSNTADVPCVYDAWMHFRLHVDTDTDVAQYYYTAPGESEVLMCEWQWSLDSFGNNVVGRTLSAMDFYPPQNAATSEFYLDNFSFRKTSGESAPAFSITPTSIQRTLGYDDMTSVPVTINNYGNSIGDWTGWLDFGQGGAGSQTTELYYHNGDVASILGIGSTSAYTREMGMRLPGNAYAGSSMGMRIISTKYFISPSYQSANHYYTFRIYGQGQSGQPGQLLAEKTVYSTASDTWITATFDNPVYLTGQTIWATVQLEQAASEYPMSMDGGNYGEESDGNWLSTNGGNFSHCYSYGNFSGAWMITVNCQGHLIPATWASINKTEGSIMGGESDVVTLSLNSIGLQNGTYNANFVVNTNEANMPQVVVPITLNVGNGKSANEMSSSELLPTDDDYLKEERGTVRVSGTFDAGATCVLTATPNEGYTFTSWTKDGVEVSTNATYSFTVTENAAYVANFSSGGNHWGVDIYQYPYNMSVTGIIQIYGEEQQTTALEIGAFCGDVCRGTQRLTYFPQVNRYLVFLTLYGDAGDVMSFRLYDHSLGEELDLSCNSTITFVPDGFMGTPFDPYVFDFGNLTVDQVTNFSEGYNWWSTYIEQEGIDGMGMLQEGLGGNGISIRSQASGYTDYYTGYGWFGSLTSIDNESSYRVITSAPCSVTMTGNLAVPSEHPVTLSQGWTWIGYVPSTEMDINAAMSGMTPASGDKLKSQQGYADYYVGYGWFGSLAMIEPGMGLMYYSTSSTPVTFTYPDNAKGGEPRANMTAENNHWVPNTYAYPDNMTVMAVVDLDDEELASDSYELAAFANGECRGSVRLTYAEPINRHVAFLTISGKDAAELSFRLYDTETGMEYYDAEESLTFTANAIVGDADNLFTIHFRGTTGMDEFASKVRVYPNPVNNGEQFSIGLDDDVNNLVRVEIVNALGVETMRATSVQTPAMLTAPATAGVYTLRITVEGKGTLIRKLVVK